MILPLRCRGLGVTGTFRGARFLARVLEAAGSLATRDWVDIFCVGVTVDSGVNKTRRTPQAAFAQSAMRAT